MLPSPWVSMLCAAVAWSLAASRARTDSSPTSATHSSACSGAACVSSTSAGPATRWVTASASFSFNMGTSGTTASNSVGAVCPASPWGALCCFLRVPATASFFGMSAYSSHVESSRRTYACSTSMDPRSEEALSGMVRSRSAGTRSGRSCLRQVLSSFNSSSPSPSSAGSRSSSSPAPGSCGSSTAGSSSSPSLSSSAGAFSGFLACFFAFGFAFLFGASSIMRHLRSSSSLPIGLHRSGRSR
mmetsp:Transcript_14648/g.50341  ORF Transcript_14648/g.50341 Transcript_14648/m.50341 type:complete len:243 (+) Transcript_14648:186-914(+)